MNYDKIKSALETYADMNGHPAGAMEMSPATYMGLTRELDLHPRSKEAATDTRRQGIRQAYAGLQNQSNRPTQEGGEAMNEKQKDDLENILVLVILSMTVMEYFIPGTILVLALICSGVFIGWKVLFS